TEDFFHTLENLFLYRLIFSFDGCGEFRQQVLLVPVELRGNGDIDGDVEIAASGSSAFGNTTALDAGRGSCLGAGMNRQVFFFKFESGNDDMRAESGLGK